MCEANASVNGSVCIMSEMGSKYSSLIYLKKVGQISLRIPPYILSYFILINKKKRYIKEDDRGMFLLL